MSWEDLAPKLAFAADGERQVETVCVQLDFFSIFSRFLPLILGYRYLVAERQLKEMSSWRLPFVISRFKRAGVFCRTPNG